MDLRRTLRVSVREVIFPHVRLVILYDLPLKFFLLFPKKNWGDVYFAFFYFHFFPSFTGHSCLLSHEGCYVVEKSTETNPLVASFSF